MRGSAAYRCTVSLRFGMGIVMRERGFISSAAGRELLRQIRRELRNGRILEGEWLHDRQYLDCIMDILTHPEVMHMSEYRQHGQTTTLDHCLAVSYVSYRISRNLSLDYRSAARGGLLHDLFLYDWHSHARESGEHFHGMTHPRLALQNADKYFALNKKERDIIVKHMWPLTVIPPKYAEGFVIMYADKYCGLAEVVKRIQKSLAASRPAKES